MNNIRRTFATSSTWSHFTIERNGLNGRMSSGHNELLQRLPLHINLGAGIMNPLTSLRARDS
jgi:hypothetical protein